MSIIKNIKALFIKKNKNGAGYLKSELPLHSLPGQSSHHAGRKGLLPRIRQVFSAQKRVTHTNYKRPVDKRKLIFKGGGFIVATLCLLFAVVFGIKQLVPDNFEKFPFFQVSAMTYSGNETLSNDRLRAASGIFLHQTSLLGLNCAKIEAALVALPWVAQAEVKKNWPSTVEIVIVENIPVALLHQGGPEGSQLQYIDKTGQAFLRVTPGADIDFPIITGLDTIKEPEIRQKAFAEVLIFLDKINSNNPQLPAQSVSEISLNDKGEMAVYLVEYPFPIFFGSSDTAKKFYRLVQVLKTLYKQKENESIAQIAYIQMNYLQDKVLVVRALENRQ